MPKNQDGLRKDPSSTDSPILRNLVLLALPLLSFHRDVLGIMKKGIEDASHVRPIENLTSRELQALMMIVDPSGKWRNLLGNDVPEQIKQAHKKLFPKLVSGSMLLIEAQDAILASISERLNELRRETQRTASTRKNDRAGD
jgi:hypothetical protein